MQRCLRLPEILQDVLSNLPRSDLTRTARACRLFLEPSLSLIWAYPPSLIPLLFLFPPDSLSFLPASHTSIPIFHFHLMFARELTESDWTRFDYYAPRVRSLEHCRPYNGMISPSTPRRSYMVPEETFNQLCLSRPGQPVSKPLLPRLRSLLWRVNRPEIVPFIRLFLSQSLERLTIMMYPCPPHIDAVLQPLLSSVSSRCPNITFLALSGVQSNSILLGTSSGCGMPWVRLTSVALENGTIDQLRCLTALPNLVTLEFGDPIGSLADFVASKLNYESLRELSITNFKTSLAVLCDLLEIISANCLTSVYLRCFQNGEYSIDSLRGLFGSLCRYKTVTCLTVQIYDEREQSDRGPYFYPVVLAREEHEASDLLGPILGLNALDRLIIRLPSFRPDNNSLERIATSFPRLRQLILESSEL